MKNKCLLRWLSRGKKTQLQIRNISIYVSHYIIWIFIYGTMMLFKLRYKLSSWQSFVVYLIKSTRMRSSTEEKPGCLRSCLWQWGNRSRHGVVQLGPPPVLCAVDGGGRGLECQSGTVINGLYHLSDRGSISGVRRAMFSAMSNSTKIRAEADVTLMDIYIEIFKYISAFLYYK